MQGSGKANAVLIAEMSTSVSTSVSTSTVETAEDAEDAVEDLFADLFAEVDTQPGRPEEQRSLISIGSLLDSVSVTGWMKRRKGAQAKVGQAMLLFE